MPHAVCRGIRSLSVIVLALVAGLSVPCRTWGVAEQCTTSPINTLYSEDLPTAPANPTLCPSAVARCETPIEEGRFLRHKTPGCDPEAGNCTMQLGVRLRYPGNELNLGQNLGTGKAYWYDSSTAPGCNPLQVPFPNCGQRGICGNGVISQSLFNTDLVETWIEIPASCATADSIDLHYSVDAWICMTNAACDRWLPVDDLAFGGASLAAALGCEVPKPEVCPQDADCETCRGSGQAGAGVGGGGGGAAPGGSGPAGFGGGGGLGYAAGGVGGAGSPGSLAGSRGGTDAIAGLGRYWMHPWAERIVVDPDDSHVWLLTGSATFREFSDLAARGESPQSPRARDDSLDRGGKPQSNRGFVEDFPTKSRRISSARRPAEFHHGLLVGGVYTTAGPSDEYRELRRTGGGWELEDLAGTVQSFDHAGLWSGTVDRWGNATTPAYTGSDLTGVAFPDGRRLELAYAAGMLSTITEWGVGDADSRMWSYTWSGDDLTRIDRPDGTAWVFAYADPMHPGFMTRMTLEGTGAGSRIEGAWEYDAEGNATHFWRGTPGKDDAGVVDRWEFQFDDPVLPTETVVIDPLGNSATIDLARDTVSTKVKITGTTGDCPSCSLGPETQREYTDAAHPLRPTAEVDGLDHRKEMTYASRGQVATLTEPVGDATVPPRTTAWTYSAAYPVLPTLIERPSVNVGSMRTTMLDYDVVGNLTLRTESGDEATRPGGTFSLGTAFPSYNAAGQVETIDPPGHGTADQTTFTYDAARGDLLPATRQDPLLAAPSQFGYDPLNRRARTLDPHGVATDTVYDDLDRVRFAIQRVTLGLPRNPPDPLEPIDPADLVTEHVYDEFGDLFQTILPEGNVLEYGYDLAGRLVTIERKPDAVTPGERTLYALDAVGNRTAEELQEWTGAAWATVSETTYDYPTRCRLAKVTRGAGQPEEAVTEYAYDCDGQLEEVWDAEHDRLVDPPTQTYVYDALHRLVEVREPWAAGGEAVTGYGYDVQDHLISVLDAESNETTYEYSDRDLLTEEVSPVSGTTTHTYDEHGELTDSTDARGVTITRTVDALDRVTEVTYAGIASPSTQYTYDTAAPSCTVGEDFAIGRLASITRDGGTLEYCSDRFGRTTRDGELTYGYDENGNRTALGYPGGVSASYGFDYADREVSLTVDDGVNPPQPVASGSTYFPFGPLATVTLGNGLLETHNVDARYVPDSITAGALLSWDYTTDGVGNITQIADLLTPADNRTYGYQDVQYFLTSAAGPWGALGWTYDRIGNRLTEDRDATVETYSYLQNGCVPPGIAGRPCPGNTALLDSIALGAGGTRDYTFGVGGHLEEVLAGANQVLLTSDGEGRLIELSRPAAHRTATLAYDGRSFLTGGREFPTDDVLFADSFETGDTGCWSAREGAPPVAPGPGCFSDEQIRTRPLYSSQGTLQALRQRPDPWSDEDVAYVLYLAGRPVGQLDLPSSGAGVWTFLTTDHLGTPVLATDLAGAPVWQGGFEPFGTDWQAGGPNGASENGVFLRLPGQWDDASWQGASEGVETYYNVHRWYEAGVGSYVRPDPAGLIRSNLDLYGYSLRNPTRFIDPSGLTTCVVVSANSLFELGDTHFAVGDHSALLVAGPCQTPGSCSSPAPLLYDPAGGYSLQFPGSGSAQVLSDAIPGWSLGGFFDYHCDSGSDFLEIYCFDTTCCEEEKISQQFRSAGVLECSTRVGGAVRGVEPFSDLGVTMTPALLRRGLNRLLQKHKNAGAWTWTYSCPQSGSR